MKPAQVKPPISPDLLNQIDIRVGTILTVTDIPNSEKLVALQGGRIDRRHAGTAPINAHSRYTGRDAASALLRSRTTLSVALEFKRPNNCRSPVFAMSTRMNLGDVLADLGSTYNAVDVRTAAYRVKGTWYNLITVIRFSELEEDQLEQNINADWRRLKAVTHERLRVEHRTFRYDDRDRLVQTFSTGVAEFGDLKVQLGRPVDLLSDMGYIQPRSFGDPLCRWPALEIQGNTSQWIVDQNITQTIRSADSSDDELRRYLSTRGYASLGDAVVSFLGLSKSNHTSFTSAVYTWAPILADVKEARWNPGGALPRKPCLPKYSTVCPKIKPGHNGAMGVLG